MGMTSEVLDRAMNDAGRLRVEWAAAEMPVLGTLRDRFMGERPLEGIRIGACLHVTSETANLIECLRAGGATVSLCASNPLSTQDEVAAYLSTREGIAVYAVRGEDTETYYGHLRKVLDLQPQIVLDDGADLISTLHTEHQDSAGQVIGGCEETTTGVVRLRSMERDGVLKFPVVAVNEAKSKQYFDNRYGTGQSTIDGLLRATNLLLAGRTFVVCGYGFCGRGLALRARGMGAQVVVCEIDPMKALEAVMEGYRVLPLAEAAGEGDVFVTVTGNVAVLREEHFREMKDGAVLANSGHFNVEIDLPALEALATSQRTVRNHVVEYRMPDGRHLYLVAQGRLVNLAAAEGHPAAVMDMSFANQALSVVYLTTEGSRLAPAVYPVPQALDEEVARLKLQALGVEIDTLTPEQAEYLSSWQKGT